ncbi:MAG: molybdate ABC transporter substrate-binding protein [Verrucomicrobia bacterium Tous-C9LFEB]|nr:MAG: molybdate ABC transporter substrate-binding protein [Verrucomicrobia bacterium Tous-C9LFEB]
MKSFALLLLSLLLATPLRADTTLVIVADNTLRAALPELTQIWADKQPDMNVELQFTNAETMQKQIVDNKGGDVLIFANADDLKEATKRGYILASEQKQIARNDLIVYGRKALLPDEELEWFDLVAREWETLALGDPSRTASGRAAQAALKKHDLEARVKGKETRLCGNEAAALDCARRAEVEAVFVLNTDLGKTVIDGFVAYPINRADYPGIFYIAAPTKNTKAPSAARSYIQSLAAPESLPIWTKYGFNRPDAGTVQLR